MHPLLSLLSLCALIFAGSACREFIGPVNALGIVAWCFIFGILTFLFKRNRLVGILRCGLWGAAAGALCAAMMIAQIRQGRIATLVIQLHTMHEQVGTFPSKVDFLIEARKLGVDNLVSSYLEDKSHFVLVYHLIAPSIAHWYDSSIGWGHDDD